MKLDLIDNFLQIKLNPLEIILAHRGSLSIPLDHVIHASAEKPKWDFVAIRAPGTHIPFSKSWYISQQTWQRILACNDKQISSSCRVEGLGL